MAKLATIIIVPPLSNPSDVTVIISWIAPLIPTNNTHTPFACIRVS